jgi:hypothetical protein
VADLEDQFRLKGGSDAIKKEIVELAVAHTLLTRFTAFVVVDESEIVNEGGDVRKVVQPVHEPDRWEMEKDQAQAPGSLASIATNFGSPAKSKLDDVFGDEACLESAPPPPPSAPRPIASPRGASTPMPPKSPAPSKKIGMFSKLFGGGKGAAPEEQKREATRISRPTPPDTTGIEKALDALAKAYAAARAEVKAGRVPKADGLEQARKELMKALAASVVGQQLGKLQKFLRSALMEIVAALGTAGATASSIAPLFERHAEALAEAAKELKTPFWEGSI